MSIEDQQISPLISPYDQGAEDVKGTHTGTGEIITDQNQYYSGGTTALYATLAGIAIGGPLLCMMGFSFTASATIFLISSPLLFIFSPILISAAFVLVTAMASLAAAATLGLAGGWAFRLMLRAKSNGIGFGPGPGPEYESEHEAESDVGGSPEIVSTESPKRTVGRMIGEKVTTVAEEEEVTPVTEERQRGKENKGKDSGGHLQHKVNATPPKGYRRSILVECMSS